MKNRIGSWNEVDVYRVSNFVDAITQDDAIYVFDVDMYYKCHKVGYIRGSTVYDFNYDEFNSLRNRQPPAANSSKKEETSSTSGKSEEEELLRVPSAEELDKFFNSISVKLEDYICSG